MAKTSTGTGTAPTSLPGPLGAPFDRRTYRNIAYLLVRFPLGVAYFTVFVTGLSVGIATAPVGIGVAVLAGVLGLAEYAALVEAKLLRSLFDRDVRVSPTDPGAVPMVAYLKTVGTRRRNYVLVAFFLASFFVGVAAFVAVVVSLALAGALLVAPLVFWLPWTQYGTVETEVVGIAVSPVDTLPEALLASVLGAVLGLVALWVFNAAATALAGVTERVVAD